MESLTKQLKRQLTQYGVIPSKAWKALCSQLHPVFVRTRQLLPVKPGAIYFVSKGLLKECVGWRADGEFSILRLAAEGSVVFAPKVIANRYYEALEDCELLELTWQAALLLSLRHPCLRLHYEQLLSAWLQLLPDRVRWVRMPSDQRESHFLGSHPALKTRINTRDLANYLAMPYDFWVF